jgi:hypothetical protein
MRCPLHHPQKFHSVGRNNALQRGPVRIRSKLPRRTALNAVSTVGQQPGRKQASLGSVPVSLVSHPDPTTAPWGRCLVRSRLCSTERSAEADVPQLGIAVSQYIEYNSASEGRPPASASNQPASPRASQSPASSSLSARLPLLFPSAAAPSFNVNYSTLVVNQDDTVDLSVEEEGRYRTSRNCLARVNRIDLPLLPSYRLLDVATSDPRVHPSSWFHPPNNTGIPTTRSTKDYFGIKDNSPTSDTCFFCIQSEFLTTVVPAPRTCP